MRMRMGGLIQLKAMSASSIPTLLIQAGSERVEIKNVLVGEVWLCSGQSNMEWTVEQSANFEEEQARANYPQIRMITVKKKFSTEPQLTFKGQWSQQPLNLWDHFLQLVIILKRTI